MLEKAFQTNQKDDRYSIFEPSSLQITRQLEPSFSNLERAPSTNTIIHAGYLKIIEGLGLNALTLAAIKGEEFKIFKGIIDSVLSGNATYLQLIRLILQKINDKEIVTPLYENLKENLTSEVLVKLIVGLQAYLRSTESKKTLVSDNELVSNLLDNFIDLLVKKDSITRMLIEKILSERLLEIREIIFRIILDHNGRITPKIFEELKTAISAFPKETAIRNDDGVHPNTPHSIRQICQLFLIAFTSIQEESGQRIRRKVMIDDKEVEVGFSSSAIADSYAAIAKINLEKSLASTSEDFKVKIEEASKNKLPDFFKNVIRNLVPPEKLRRDIILLSSNTRFLNLTASNLGIKINPDLLVSRIKKDFEIMVERNQINEKIINLNYVKPIIDGLLISNAENLKIELSESISNTFYEVLNADKETIETILTDLEIKNNLILKALSPLNEIKKNSSPEISTIINKTEIRFRAKFEILLSEIAMLHHLSNSIKLLNSRNVTQIIGDTYDFFHLNDKRITGEKKRKSLSDNSTRKLAEAIAKIAWTYHDVENLRIIFTTGQFENSNVIKSESVRHILQLISSNKPHINEKDNNRILKILGNLKFEKFLKLENKVLGENLYKATTEDYSRLYPEDLIFICKSVLNKDLNILKKLKNTELAGAVVEFVEYLKLFDYLDLSKNSSVNFLKGMIAIIPGSLYGVLVKIMEFFLPEEKQLPKITDIPDLRNLPTMLKGICQQVPSNIENTLYALFKQLFVKFPDLYKKFTSRTNFFLELNSYFNTLTSWPILLESIKEGIKDGDKIELKKINQSIEEWTAFQSSLMRMLESMDIIGAFENEWKNKNFKKRCEELLKKYRGSNSLLFLIKRCIGFEGDSKENLNKAAAECYPLLRISLVEMTLFAINMIGKPEEERKKYIETKPASNIEEMIRNAAREVGLHREFIDFSGKKHVYARLLTESFSGMLGDTFTSRGDGEFIEFLKTQTWERSPRNTVDGSDKTLEYALRKKPNPGAYRAIMDVLFRPGAEKTHVLAIGLPLAVNNESTSDGAKIIQNVISASPIGIAIKEIQHVLQKLTIELGISRKVFLEIINPFSENGRNLEKLEHILKLMRPFDISIIMALESENLFIKLCQLGNTDLALRLLQHCREKNQIYPILITVPEIIKDLNFNNEIFIKKLLEAFKSFKLEKVYLSTIKDLLKQKTIIPKDMSIILPLAFEIGNWKILKKALLKFIRTHYDIFLEVISESYASYSQKAPILGENQKDNSPHSLIILTAQGKNPLFALLQNRKTMGTSPEIENFFSFCIKNNLVYPILECLIKNIDYIIADVDLFKSFHSVLDKMEALKELQSVKVFEDIVGTRKEKEVLRKILNISATFENVKAANNAVLNFVGSQLSFQEAVVYLSDVYRHLPLNIVMAGKLKLAIENNRIEEVQNILKSNHRMLLSIMCARQRYDAIAIAHAQDFKEILEMLMKYCVDNLQIFPLLYSSTTNMFMDPQIIKSLADALEQLGVKPSEIKEFASLDLKDKKDRETIFEYWFNGREKVTADNIALFTGFEEELYGYFTEKLSFMHSDISNPDFIQNRLMGLLNHLKALPKNQIIKKLIEGLQNYVIENPAVILSMEENINIRDRARINMPMMLSSLDVTEELIFNGFLAGRYKPVDTRLVSLFPCSSQKILALIQDKIRKLNTLSEVECENLKSLIQVIKQVSADPKAAQMVKYIIENPESITTEGQAHMSVMLTNFGITEELVFNGILAGGYKYAGASLILFFPESSQKILALIQDKIKNINTLGRPEYENLKYLVQIIKQMSEDKNKLAQEIFINIQKKVEEVGILYTSPSYVG